MGMIELTIWDNNPLYINPDYIVTIYTEKYFSTEKFYTRIGLVGINVGEEFLVKETPEQILNLIKNAK